MRRLLVAAGILALLPLAALPVTAQASPTPSPTGAPPEAPLSVQVTTLLPRAPQEHGPVQVKGVIKNVGNAQVTGITVRLKVGEVVQYRDQLHEADTDRPLTSTRRTTTPVLTSLAPGASLGFDIRTTTDQLDMHRQGAYPLDIEAHGSVAGADPVALGLAPTWLPFFPGVNPNPLRVAVLLPVVDEPHQGVDATLRDDALATTLASRGRLWAVVNAGRAAANPECEPAALGPKGMSAPAPTRCLAVPVTFGVDPDLLVAATTMSRPYNVKGDDGKTTDGKGTDAAQKWLASMREAARTDQVLGLPYADPDVTALARRGEGGPDDLANAMALGRSTVADLLKANPVDSLAWPPAGPVSQAAADLLARSGAKALVLDESAYGQPDVEPPVTPNARSVFTSSATGAELDGLVADSYLSALVVGPGAAALGPRLAEQRFLAETALLSAQTTSAFRTYVIAPERRTEASIQALTASLRDLGRVPWLCPVSLTSVAAGTEACGGHPGPVREPAPRGNPRTDTSGQLSAAYLSAVSSDRKVIEQLTTAVFSDSQDQGVRALVAATKSRLRQAVARAESSAWRSDPSVAQVRVRDLHREVGRLSQKVAVRGGKALLTSSKGTLQVNLENTLDVPVDVRVRFSTASGTIPPTTTGLLDVSPGHAIQAGVKVAPKTSGQFVVLAQILDRNGASFNPPTVVIVRSTRFGRLAVAVTLGAAGVLFLAAGIRIMRRALSSRS